jgi:hypothetical protein
MDTWQIIILVGLIGFVAITATPIIRSIVSDRWIKVRNENGNVVGERHP